MFCPHNLHYGESLVSKPNGTPGAGEDRRECVRHACQWWINEVAINPLNGKPTPTGSGNCVTVMGYIATQQNNAMLQTLVQLQMKQMKLTVNPKGEIVEERGN